MRDEQGSDEGASEDIILVWDLSLLLVAAIGGESWCRLLVGLGLDQGLGLGLGLSLVTPSKCSPSKRTLKQYSTRS